MISVISPSKSLDFECGTYPQHSSPFFLSRAASLAHHMKTMSREDLEALMKISPRLSALNHQRWQDFDAPPSPENNGQALRVFTGDVYRGIGVDEYAADDFTFAQQHLRILSGLYGLLRPLDLIRPHRLEMGTRLSGAWGKNLYTFWQDRISQRINEEMAASRGDQVLVNLASKEYFKAVRPKMLDFPIVDIAFKEKKGDNYKVIAIHAKRARGVMVDFIVKNSLTRADDLKQFSENGYAFNAGLSCEREWVFTRK